MLTDPIAALATPPGRSALAVLRLSGTGAFEVARRVVRGFRERPARTARRATFQSPDGEPLDDGLYLVFPGPGSYTGEDLVELFCHGGLLAPAQVLAALHRAGARPAAPGEFTRRAVLNGRMDLLQAEAVGDLIDATAPAQGRAALRQLEGGLSTRLTALRGRLVDLMALLGYEVDFPEEDDGPVPRTRIAAELAAVRADLALLLASAPLGERLREGALVVLAGPPNAGKSSLFNALLGTERALVTEVPGTTRDTIEAHTAVEGWPVRLADTAGLWDAPDRLDRLGVEVSHRYLEAADLVLFCVERGSEEVGGDERIRNDPRTLVVHTKADLISDGPDERDLRVSAVTGEGLDRLRAALRDRLYGAGERWADLEPLLTRERHRAAMERAAAELEAAGPQLEDGGEPVLAAHHVRGAVLALDELVGAVDLEDVLERIFSRFCVGK